MQVRARGRRSPRGARHGARRVAPALAVAALVHGGLIWWLGNGLLPALPRPSMSAPARSPAPALPASASSVTLITLRDQRPGATIPLGPPQRTVDGSDDHGSLRPGHPAPLHSRDLPGERAASAGGGAPGGRDSWTGRRDRENFQSQAWNDPERNRLPRNRRHAARAPASPESWVRQPERGFDDRSESRPAARAGAVAPAPGGTHARSQGGPADLPRAERDRDDADPVLDSPPGAPAPRALPGATGPRGQALADPGASATEAPARGPIADRHDVAAASAEPDPAPIEMTSPRAGGTRTGVAGRHGHGVSAQGRDHGSSATTAAAPRGPGRLSVRARRHDPYFRRMYERLDRHIVFPHDLALSLRQGEVVVAFTLSAGGDVSRLSMQKTSGFAAFDRELVRALGAAAPFGPVPEALLQGRPEITVVVPYMFRNPLIR
jgi:TonB family protein